MDKTVVSICFYTKMFSILQSLLNTAIIGYKIIGGRLPPAMRPKIIHGQAGIKNKILTVAGSSSNVKHIEDSSNPAPETPVLYLLSQCQYDLITRRIRGELFWRVSNWWE